VNSIKLIEYQKSYLPEDAIPQNLLEELHLNYAGKILVESPNLFNNYKIVLFPQGWVGYIPLSHEIVLDIKPKIHLTNLFRMLQYAFDLDSFNFSDGVVQYSSLNEFYDYIANYLAISILNRSRKGFYRNYLSETDRLTYCRGRIDLTDIINKPWEVSIPCCFDDHTADIRENRILAWTLACILKSGLCTEKSSGNIRKAFNCLKGLVLLEKLDPSDCHSIVYNKLNFDYKPLHLICSFFLEHSGPSLQSGERKMIPFLVNMNVLYEKFVAKWLENNIPNNIKIGTQKQIVIGEDCKVSFRADLILYEKENTKPICILETKYKIPERPESSDVAQAIAYSEIINCNTAIIVYPEPLRFPIDEKPNQIRIKSMTFSVSDDLEFAGMKFLIELKSNGIL
jgi:5-methylcytosine-specific restriction enzyme subunit McrC